MRVKRLLSVAILAGTLLADGVCLAGGAPQDEYPQPYEAQLKLALNAEINSVYIDAACAEALNAKASLFLLARPGRGERSQRLQWRRLERIRCYIQGLTNAPTLVLAVGEPVNGAGRVDFYVRGELLYRGDRPWRVYAVRNGFFRLYESETLRPAEKRCNSL